MTFHQNTHHTNAKGQTSWCSSLTHTHTHPLSQWLVNEFFQTKNHLEACVRSNKFHNSVWPTSMRPNVFHFPSTHTRTLHVSRKLIQQTAAAALANSKRSIINTVAVWTEKWHNRRKRRWKKQNISLRMSFIINENYITNFRVIEMNFQHVIVDGAQLVRSYFGFGFASNMCPTSMCCLAGACVCVCSAYAFSFRMNKTTNMPRQWHQLNACITNYSNYSNCYCNCEAKWKICANCKRTISTRDMRNDDMAWPWRMVNGRSLCVCEKSCNSICEWIWCD